MAIESERKFLVDWDKLPYKFRDMFTNGQARVSEAGYFTEPPVPAVRVTVNNHGLKNPKYKTCIKGPGTEHRAEFEHQIEAEEALELLAMAPTYLKKLRIDIEGWEIDQFQTIYVPAGHKLVVAEWELHNDNQPLTVTPGWVVREVTDDVRYTNQWLAWEFGRKSLMTLDTSE